MKQAIRATIISCIVGALSTGCLAQARKTIINPDGSKEVFDTSTGWTEVDKDGKTTNIGIADLTETCRSLEIAVKHHLSDTGGIRRACEYWAELQPRNQIEQVPFATLMVRLVEISPAVTDFARYRGAELQSQTGATLYDATIVPNDVGGNPSCTVLAAADSSGGSLYKYGCSLKTASYPDAIALENALVQRLNGLGLIEDQVAEHGFILKDKQDNECAPTGECTHSRMFASALKENKIVEVEAES